MAKAPRKPRKGDDFRFKIDAWTPETIPMLRLAEYMRELAQILGETSQVHFQRIAKGSAILKYKIEHEAVPKVRNRIALVRQGEGPTEAQKAFKEANEMLRADNASGTLRVGADILKFPGRKLAQEPIMSIRQQGFFDGVVTGVRGRDDTRHIIMQSENQQVSGFFTNRTIAKQLAAKYDEAVRVFGKGKWERNQDGAWVLLDFKIESFEALDNAPLKSVLSDLREVSSDWSSETFAELDLIRHGPKNKDNGRH